MRRLWLVLALTSCADLAPLQERQCGNGVVEPGEDCDGTAACTPSCHLSCAAAECPEPFRCGTDQICRAGTGRFERTTSIAVAQPLPGTGDVDGDGRDDLVIAEHGRLRVLHGAAGGTLLEGPDVPLWPPATSRPAVADLTGDGLPDVVLGSENALQLLLGAADRSLDLHTSGPSLPEGTGGGRPLVAFPLRGTGGAADRLLVVGSREDRAFAAPLDPAGTPAWFDDLDVSGLPPRSLRVDLDADGVEELLLQARGGDLHVLALDAGSVEGRTIDLPPGFDLPAHTRLFTSGADLILAPEEEPPLVARIAAGTVGPPGTLPLPAAWSGTLPLLAAGDLDGDDLRDLVFPDQLLIGAASVETRRGSAWTEAEIADLDGDGDLDLATAGTAGLDVHLLSCADTCTSGDVASFPLVAGAAPGLLRAGDFDGDGISDVAFVEQLRDGQALGIAYGRSAGAPEVVRGLASFRRVVSLERASLRDGSGLVDRRDDLVAVAAQGEGEDRVMVLQGAPRGLTSPFLLPSGVVRAAVALPGANSLVLLVAEAGELSAALLPLDPASWTPGRFLDLQPLGLAAADAACLHVAAVDRGVLLAGGCGPSISWARTTVTDAGGKLQVQRGTLQGLGPLVAAASSRSSLLLATPQEIVDLSPENATVRSRIGLAVASLALLELDAVPGLDLAASTDHGVVEVATGRVLSPLPGDLRAADVDGDGRDDLLLFSGESLDVLRAVDLPR